MGAITEGVVAGLQLRQRRQEFAAAQQQQAEQFANQLAMRQKEIDNEQSGRLANVLTALQTQRDRLANELPTYADKLGNVDKDLIPLRLQLDNLTSKGIPLNMSPGLLESIQSLEATRRAYAAAAETAYGNMQSIDRIIPSLSARLSVGSGASTGDSSGSAAPPMPSGAAPAANEPAMAPSLPPQAAATPSSPTQAMGPSRPIDMLASSFPSLVPAGAMLSDDGTTVDYPTQEQAKQAMEMLRANGIRPEATGISFISSGNSYGVSKDEYGASQKALEYLTSREDKARSYANAANKLRPFTTMKIEDAALEQMIKGSTNPDETSVLSAALSEADPKKRIEAFKKGVADLEAQAKDVLNDPKYREQKSLESDFISKSKKYSGAKGEGKRQTDPRELAKQLWPEWAKANGVTGTPTMEQKKAFHDFIINQTGK